MTFTVTLTGTTTQDVTFDFTTSNGSATAGLDYTNTNGTSGVITVGQTTTTITVPITDDYDLESDETFTVTLTNVSANADLVHVDTDLVGLGTIQDEGTPLADDTVTLKVVATDAAGNILTDPAANAVNEGDKAYYKVIAVDPLGVEIASPAAGTVDVSFSNVTATGLDDVIANASNDGTDDFISSTVTATIGTVFSVDAVDDLASDDEETYTAGLVNGTVTGAVLTSYEAVATSPDTVTTTIHDETTPGGPPGTPTPGPEDTVTLKVVATDSSGNIIGDGSASAVNEGITAYYKVVAYIEDPANLGTQIEYTGAVGNVDIDFTDVTASGANTLVGTAKDGTVDYVNTSQNVAIGAVFSADTRDDLASDDEELILSIFKLIR